MPRAALATAVAAVTTLFGMGPSVPAIEMPETVTFPAGTFLHRTSAEVRIGTRQIDPPVERLTLGSFAIMTHQVTQEDYARCVADRDCLPAPTEPGTLLPQTGLNWSDGAAYAAWLSEETGQDWRLPTDAEWLRAAAERGFDGALGAEATDPSERWLASYRAEVSRRGEADLVPHPQGHFGQNSLGLWDMAGNVWEWTESCDEKRASSLEGRLIASERFCGVRVAQDKHRAFLVDFVRDARSGGCAAGIPPDFLGLRLVHDLP
ncbi:SUMF1/EgtB/PvdO family nonheme iron enzyme [Cereibacter sphaeroides]|uniref:SUMF1/EgtB/PvdO family nonheme iron enzyme n=1 Tax=Cereibacter sphaeroides TaxID=1063 RepID=UPI00313AE917